jgi:hypothetical protein
MDQPLVAALQAVRSTHGSWSAHNIKLADGVYTIGTTPNYDNLKLNRITQLVHAFKMKPWEDLRVLDLASQDGMYSIELGLHGADVLGVEIRESHLARANFARETLRLPRVRFQQGDVCALDPEQVGHHDVVLVLGILYHLTAEDVARLVQKLAVICTDFVVLDTHVSLESSGEFHWEGQTYYGRRQREHPVGATAGEKAARGWYSWKNDESFVFTEGSLVALLERLGFRTVVKCLAPSEAGKSLDRVTLVAFRRDLTSLCAFPELEPATVNRLLRPEELANGGPADGRLVRAARWIENRLHRLFRRPSAGRPRETTGC